MSRLVLIGCGGSAIPGPVLTRSLPTKRTEVLTLEGARVKDITAFVFPKLFPRFGLPAELPATGVPARETQSAANKKAPNL